VETLLQQALNGIAIAGVYALLALGISLVFGLTGIVNFAHGEFLMLGGLITYSLSEAGWPFVFAAAAATVAMGLTGWVVERVMFRPTIVAPVRGFIVSLGLIVVFQNVAIKIWGTEQQRIAPPIEGSVDIGDVTVGVMRFVVVGVALVVFVLLFLLLKRTAWGRAIRAVAIDKETAEFLGVPVNGLISAVFVIGAAVAGLAGALVLGLFPVSAFSGEQYVIKGFAVAIVGGLGNMVGAVVAALLLGVLEAVAAGYFSPAWATAYAFAAMIAVLLLRPGGLFRGTE
jgi:branched-chain amino acid transport system permease protein